MPDGVWVGVTIIVIFSYVSYFYSFLFFFSRSGISILSGYALLFSSLGDFGFLSPRYFPSLDHFDCAGIREKGGKVAVRAIGQSSGMSTKAKKEEKLGNSDLAPFICVGSNYELHLPNRPAGSWT